MPFAFRPVNNPPPAGQAGQETSSPSPMTPRPTSAPAPCPKPLDEATTPTRASFGTSTLASQKPLPTSPFPESVQVPESAAGPSKMVPSHNARASKDSGDSEMGVLDGEDHAGDDGAGSDAESANGDGSKPKKKKPQRFFCLKHPPCTLSFTRSEHLARHIRKHTGERPFQCHCSRRFSRLDNLRQHAQTVHANEDIPADSPAATGTRFQRQIRTDRVRPSGRARASTAGSVGPAGRGHSKSLSTSSIATVSSLASGYSVTDTRRRPPPLVMADPRSRIPLDSYRGNEGQYYQPPSPGDFSTPTSATFSTGTGQNSPRWGPVLSPGTPHSRSHSMYAAGPRTPGRRLSVPSGHNPFQSPHGPGARVPVFYGHSAHNSSNAGALPSQNTLLASPTSSTATWSRRDSTSSTADEAWRRRTWHPDTRDYNGTSRLSQVLTPTQIPPDPILLPAPRPTIHQQQPMRLPGIASFDEISRHNPFDDMSRRLPPPRGLSPMVVDTEAPRRFPQYQPVVEPAVESQHRPAPQWGTDLNRGLDRLAINVPPTDTAGTWAREANQALSARAEQAPVRFEPEANLVPQHLPSMAGVFSDAAPARHQHTMSAPSPNAARESRRHGWYHGFAIRPAGETIHEGRPPHVDRIVHPNVSTFRPFPPREDETYTYTQPSGPPVERMDRTDRIDRMEQIPERSPNQPGDSDQLKRLEALVAVATSDRSMPPNMY
ncbi:hypothetical protein F5144DRAFT_588068 [Chaetomium tenue]|uniref:Uncharacterized protein n=1 Tax=Chaetomium tenue TaxID=1854479 RepID=A0ACB7PM53_9PEZI|nr:hypothetical protein F5144DRAFT_588068 [Chaetomium globosum]